MATLSTTQSIYSYQNFRFISPELIEHKEIKNAFFEIIKSVAKQLGKAQSGQFSEYLNGIIAELPQNKQTAKIATLANEFTQGLEGLELTKPPQETSAFKRWFLDILFSANLFLNSLIVQKEIPIEIPKFLENHLSVSPDTLSCFDYAFCQISEKRTLETDYGNDNEFLPYFLRKWGYQPIQDQDARPDDLVLYLDEEIPMHLGVYKGDGLVLSKWGDDTPMAYLHKLEIAPASYGNTVIIFRPPAKTSSHYTAVGLKL